MDDRLLEVARARQGLHARRRRARALHDAAVPAGRLGPLLEVGTYCGKSAVYLGAAARAAGHRAVHGRSSPGIRGEPGRLGAPRPRGRRSRDRAHGHAAVLPAHHRRPPLWKTSSSGSSATRCRRAGLARRRSASCSSTAATPRTSRWPTTRTGRRHVLTGGTLAIHDVFDDPAAGGQAPFRVWQRAVADGFEPVSTTGSLRVLRNGTSTPNR